MCSVDPRCITHEGDSDRGDVIIPMSEVKMLISLKEQLDESVATVWLTTSELGFSLTDESQMDICSRDVKEGKVTDRYLAPAISKSSVAIQAVEEREPTMDPKEKELRREVVHLHQRWGKVREESTNDETRKRVRMSVVETQGFTRMVLRKNLMWERDSHARTTYNPENILDCNVDATVGKHFLVHEPIPRSENGQGYLLVTRSSLWWQQREFPNVWTSEGLTTCVEKGYKWSINSTTWNHLHLRAFKSINEANVMVGESAITCAPFFQSAGLPSKKNWGPQQGNKVILWESLNAGEKEESKTKRKAGLPGARPIRRTKGNRHSGSTVDACLRVGARSRLMIISLSLTQTHDGETPKKLMLYHELMIAHLSLLHALVPL